MSAAASDRRPDLDWIRVGAFFLLILYHVGMFYVPWDWHVKSPRPVAALEPLMLATNPWRLTLLFLVSGAASRFMADKMSAGALARSRTARLLPPLLLAVFVIVPPQSYYEIVEQIGFAGSYADFYGKYATASGDWCDADGCLITPTYNHMWFVAYLLVYTLLAAALLPVLRGRLGALDRGVERWLSGWRLLALPIAFLAAIRILLLPAFPVTHALVDDWYNHALSFTAFVMGFLIAKSEPMKAALVRVRWIALGLGLSSYGLLAWGRTVDGLPAWAEPVGLVAYAVDQWSFIAAILGFGAKHLTRGGPVLSYLTLGVFPFYIVHQTFIVVAGHHLARLGLPQGLEAALLLAGTFAVCFATYEAVRRVAILRPLFGLKPQGRAAVRNRPEIAPGHASGQ